MHDDIRLSNGRLIGHVGIGQNISEVIALDGQNMTDAEWSEYGRMVAQQASDAQKARHAASKAAYQLAKYKRVV